MVTAAPARPPLVDPAAQQVAGDPIAVVGTPDLDAVRAVAGAVTDPEIPVLTLADLGILREVSFFDGRLRVTLTPTYTGCPATQVIEQDVRAALADGGWPDAQVVTTLSPPWSTDWISLAGREKLRAYGIAPPGAVRKSEVKVVMVHRDRQALSGDAAHVEQQEAGPEACPRCASTRVERLAQHASTACKALYRCLSCREPFDFFKPY